LKELYAIDELRRFKKKEMRREASIKILSTDLCELRNTC